jgi:hypothetical protein
VSSNTPRASRRMRWQQRALLAAGLVTPATLLVLIVDGASRPGYDAWRHQLSHLAIGQRGWLGTAELALAGLGVLCAGAGLRRNAALGQWVPRLLALTGGALIAAAAFHIDPGQGYPPGTVAVRTWHGTVHDAAGLGVFAGLTAAAAIASRHLRNGTWRQEWSRASAICAWVIPFSWLAGSVLTGLDYAGIWSSPPSGFFERIAAFTGLLWVAAISLRALTGPLAEQRMPVATAATRRAGKAEPNQQRM